MWCFKSISAQAFIGATMWCLTEVHLESYVLEVLDNYPVLWCRRGVDIITRSVNPLEWSHIQSCENGCSTTHKMWSARFVPNLNFTQAPKTAMMHWAGIDFLQMISELVRGRTLNLYPKRPECVLSE